MILNLFLHFYFDENQILDELQCKLQKSFQNFQKSMKFENFFRNERINDFWENKNVKIIFSSDFELIFTFLF